MEQSSFRNPHGLTAPEHQASAADLVKLAHAALQLPRLRAIVQTRQFGCQVTGSNGYVRNVKWENTNKLLKISGYQGVKTGTTTAAGACLVAGADIGTAIGEALALLPVESDCAAAVALGRSVAAAGDGPESIHSAYEGMSPVHTVNNLALVAWGLTRGADDFSVAIGDTVAAGWDTDCNGATVGALWGLTGRPVPDHWAAPWAGRVQTTLAGVGELSVDDLVARTLSVVG